MPRNFIALLSCLTLSSVVTAQPCTQRWSTGFAQDGPSDTVNAVVQFDPDGAGPLPPVLVIGGDFKLIGNAQIPYLAQWDGVQWRVLGGTFSGPVNCLAVLDPDGAGPQPESLYAGGSFANGVLRYNGSTWVNVGTGVGTTVNALTLFDDDGDGPHAPALYAGGSLTTYGYLAKFDGTNWVAAAAPLNGRVRALTAFDEDGPGPNVASLIAGGDFTTAGVLAASHVAKWNGTEWSAFGAGVPGSVNAVASIDLDGAGPALPSLLAGGLFQPGLMRWNGTGWSQLGTRLGGSTYAILAADDDGAGPHPVSPIVLGSTSLSLPLSPARGIARFDGTDWQNVGGGVNSTVYCGCTWDPDGTGPLAPRLVIGGFFTNAPNLTGGADFVPYLAQFDGTSWTSVGPDHNGGLDATAFAGTVFTENGVDRLFAAGDFLTAGGAAASHIARWNGAAWSSVGLGVNNRVRALLAFDEDGAGPLPPSLYVAGGFTAAGGQPARFIARWDGTSWFAMGDGPNLLFGASSLAAADLDGDGPEPARLYAAGSALGQPEPSIFVWANSTWSPLPSCSGSVNALTEFDPDGPGPQTPVLIAAGNITINNGPGILVASWNGQQWTNLNVAGNGPLNTVCVFDEDGPGPNPPRLFASGAVTGRVQRWNGTAWSQVGPGLSGSSPMTMSVIDEDGVGPALPVLIAAGSSFTTLAPPFPTVTMSGIGRWNGTSWSALGPGINDTTYAVVGLDEDGPGPGPPAIYAVGRFSMAGGFSSACIARWGCGDPLGCYANCDLSNLPPVLNALDFQCFLNRFASGDPYANCDDSTAPPALNVLDFTCFINKFAAGCP